MKNSWISLGFVVAVLALARGAELPLDLQLARDEAILFARIQGGSEPGDGGSSTKAEAEVFRSYVGIELDDLVAAAPIESLTILGILWPEAGNPPRRVLAVTTARPFERKKTISLLAPEPIEHKVGDKVYFTSGRKPEMAAVAPLSDRIFVFSSEAMLKRLLTRRQAAAADAAWTDVVASAASARWLTMGMRQDPAAPRDFAGKLPEEFQPLAAARCVRLAWETGGRSAIDVQLTFADAKAAEAASPAATRAIDDLRRAAASFGGELASAAETKNLGGLLRQIGEALGAAKPVRDGARLTVSLALPADIQDTMDAAVDEFPAWAVGSGWFPAPSRRTEGGPRSPEDAKEKSRETPFRADGDLPEDKVGGSRMPTLDEMTPYAHAIIAVLALAIALSWRPGHGKAFLVAFLALSFAGAVLPLAFGWLKMGGEKWESSLLAVRLMYLLSDLFLVGFLLAARPPARADVRDRAGRNPSPAQSAAGSDEAPVLAWLEKARARPEEAEPSSNSQTSSDGRAEAPDAAVVSPPRARSDSSTPAGAGMTVGVIFGALFGGAFIGLLIAFPLNSFFETELPLPAVIIVSSLVFTAMIVVARTTGGAAAALARMLVAGFCLAGLVALLIMIGTNLYLDVAKPQPQRSAGPPPRAKISGSSQGARPFPRDVSSGL